MTLRTTLVVWFRLCTRFQVCQSLDLPFNFVELFIVAGSTTACIPASSNDGPSITTNVTNKLNTCDPWSILVAGGKRPYSMYLTALQLAPAVTIVNMSANDDSYTYINRAAPGTLLLGA